MRLSFVSAVVVFLSVTNGSVGGEDLSKGLSAYWTFDGNLKSQIENSHDGMAQGTTFTADRFNQANMAISFNGSTDYLDIPDPSSLKLTNEISIAAWVYAVGGGGMNPRIVSYGGNFPSDYHGFEFLTRGNGPSRKLMFIFGDQSMTSSKSISDHTWHSVAAVGSSNSLALYINGELDSTINISDPGFFYGDSPMGIGRKSPPGRRLEVDLWGGAIDDLRIFSRAMSADEIHLLYLHESTHVMEISGIRMSEEISLELSNLVIGGSYQLEFSSDLPEWDTFSLPFTATNSAMSKQLDVNGQVAFWQLKMIP